MHARSLHLAGGLTSLSAAALLLLVLTAMNRPLDKADEARGKGAVTVIAPPPQKPPPEKVKPRPKQPPRERPPTTKPKLSASLSGLGSGVPLLGAADAFGDASQWLGDGNAKNLVMTEDAVDRTPPPLSTPAPSTPARARAHGINRGLKLRHRF
jgi:hypothetical protein